MQRSTLAKSAAVVGACAVVGAVGGIAGSAASPNKNAQTQTNEQRDHGPGGKPGFGRGFFGGPPVHAELVVPNKDGNGFVTVTEDNGTVKSVNGDQLTITEGTKDATYKDATLTIPSNATVKRNFDDAKLSDLQSGDRVHVSASPDQTFVFAVDAQHEGPPPGMRGPHGPGHPDGPYGGPPPGGP
jgi:hypothetical protein